jgi:hypothetical protein
VVDVKDQKTKSQDMFASWTPVYSTCENSQKGHGGLGQFKEDLWGQRAVQAFKFADEIV